MADTIAVLCPNCRKSLAVPAKFAGKYIKCKTCDTQLHVPDDDATLGLADAPVKAKTVKKAKAVEPARRKDDDDEDANPYGVTSDGEDVGRCPFCADVLDPPDTKVCLTCGFDLLARKRHQSKKVYQLTFGDYLKYHLPTIGCFLIVAALVTLNVFCWMNMREWFEDSFLQKDEVDPVTQKKEFWVGPGLCNTWITIPSLFVIYKAGRFVLRRLIFEWRPVETEKK